jgi:hypothetical protein
VKDPPSERRDADSRDRGSSHERTGSHERTSSQDRSSGHRAYHTTDHRYGRPSAHHVSRHSHARHDVPHRYYYRPWYTRWYVHPYYRWVVATSVFIHFSWEVHAWDAAWVPPARVGWTWVPGHVAYGHYHPGHWSPVASAPSRYGRHWVYVPGWWVGGYYVDGYYRWQSRDGWHWVDGAYDQDGDYLPGHWEPDGGGRAGYTYEPGYWDGETYVEGFWRPSSRTGYRWVSSAYATDGTYHSGYWEPIEAKPGQVWVPGWFDGNTWIDGYWVSEAEYDKADAKNYEPEKGWDAGWEGGSSAGENPPADEVPLAIPAE